jgi:Type II secretion system (T2SS), protein M subtype b
MTITERDRRALMLLAGVAVLVVGWSVFSSDDIPATVSGTPDNIPAAERRLDRLRQLSAAVPGKQQLLAQVSTELEGREKGLIQADTAAQAQAQLLQVIRTLARKQATPIELRNTEIGSVKAFGDHYGEVAVSVNFEAGIEQLMNFLADLTAQKETIGTTDLRIGSANPKQKTMPVRLTLSGLVRRELVPKQRGASTF